MFTDRGIFFVVVLAVLVVVVLVVIEADHLPRSRDLEDVFLPTRHRKKKSETNIIGTNETGAELKKTNERTKKKHVCLFFTKKKRL